MLIRSRQNVSCSRGSRVVGGRVWRWAGVQEGVDSQRRGTASSMVVAESTELNSMAERDGTHLCMSSWEMSTQTTVHVWAGNKNCASWARGPLFCIYMMKSCFSFKYQHAFFFCRQDTSNLLQTLNTIWKTIQMHLQVCTKAYTDTFK